MAGHLLIFYFLMSSFNGIFTIVIDKLDNLVRRLKTINRHQTKSLKRETSPGPKS